MAEAIIMPKTGMAMEEGVIIEWFKSVGDKIEKGDILAEIETDKSTMELEADEEGTLLSLVYEAGTTVAVTLPIAWIGEEGEEIPQAAAPAAKATGEVADSEVKIETQEVIPAVISSDLRSTPAAKRVAAERNISLESVKPSGQFGEIRERDVLALPSVTATPLAARIAAEQGTDLSTINGSGHNGKIFSGDLPQKTMTPMTTVAEDTRVPLTKIQQITGKRLLESTQQIPSVTSNMKADVTELLNLRKQINSSIETKITINDFVLMAVARALKDVPRMNSTLDGDALIYKGSINLGMAVATPKGLIVPVIPQADMMSLTNLSNKAKALAVAGREGRLQPDDLYGATFSISNIGMFGVSSFSPIINPPEAGILGVCAIEATPKFVAGELVERQIMGLSLTYDHRVVDGAESSVFLKTIRDYLEAPLTLLV